MKRSLSMVIMILLTVMVTGCIISASPDPVNVTANVGEPSYFSVTVFPSIASNARWELNTLQGEVVDSKAASFSYVFTPQPQDIGKSFLLSVFEEPGDGKTIQLVWLVSVR